MALHAARLWLLLSLTALVAGASFGAGCSSQDTADAATLRTQAAQLRALERPLLRSVKLAFIATAEHRDAAAARDLERAGVRAARVRDWLDAHERYAEANRPSVECLEETTSELREHTRDAGDRRELQRSLAEAANCIQAGD